MSHIVYFSKMFQAVPHLAQVESELPGTFVSSRRSTLRAAHNLYPALPTARYSKYFRGLSAGGRCLNNADVIVTGSPYKSFLSPYAAKKCTVFHGTYMMLSKEALLSNTHFDLLCLIGPRMKQMIERFEPEISTNAVLTGFLPFCEFPEQSVGQRESTLLRMGMSPEQKTVIYTPSRRGLGSWNLVAEQLVRTAPSNLNLVLRPHPSQALTSRAKDRASFRRVQALAENRPNTILDLTNFSLPELQSVADLVVSDANSPAEESLFYDVPQLFIETEQLSRSVLRQMGVQQEMHVDDIDQLLTLFDCGPRMYVQDGADFSSELERAMADSSQYLVPRHNYFSWVFGERDRLANQRVASAVKTHLFA